jgi:hypothetical protein
MSASIQSGIFCIPACSLKHSDCGKENYGFARWFTEVRNSGFEIQGRMVFASGVLNKRT